MSLLKKKYKIIAKDFIRAGEISIQIQAVLKKIGFDADVVRRASVCAYESEINVVMHGGNGTFDLTVDSERILMEVRDDGPGIEDIDLALQEGYSTALPEYREIGFGAGMGLPNIKKNSDSCEISSNKGEGVYLKMVVRVK